MEKTFSLVPSEDGRQFSFGIDTVIDGKTKRVEKLILFDAPINGLTNMALVDLLEDGSLSDGERSGHGQADMIFATVANVLLMFLTDNPTETIFFTGSDPEGLTIESNELSLRQRLYNRLLSKREHYDLATNYFIVYGVYGESPDPYLYKPNSSANAFLIQLKKRIL